MKRAGGGRSGSAIVEVVVAITMLGVAAVGLAGMAFHAGRGATEIGKTALRQSALSNLVDMVVTTPFGDLSALAGCTEGGTDDLRYQSCIRITDVREGLAEVTVRIDPDDGSIPSDSASVLRARGTASTPF